jgi:hypothetical protein
LNILDNFLIIAIHAVCFIAGMKLADKYHREEQRRVDYELRCFNTRLQAGDYGIYPQPAPPKRQYMGQPFVDRLRTNGRAIQQISKDKSVS